MMGELVAKTIICTMAEEADVCRHSQGVMANSRMGRGEDYTLTLYNARLLTF